LGPAVYGIHAFASLDFHELPDDLKAFCLGELPERLPLGFDPQP